MKIFTSRTLSLGLLILMLFSGCYSAKKSFQAGNYERAVQMAAKKLRKNKSKEKHAIVLEQAYKAAIDKELSRIKYLKLEGSPNSWVEVHERYSNIGRLVSIVKPLLPLYLEKEMRYADIELINVDEEQVQAKYKAADFLNAEADRLMESNDMLNARQAYNKYVKLKDLFPSYQNVDSKIKKAYDLGQEYVLIDVVNNSNQVIPKPAFELISKMPTAQYNSTWVKYKTVDDGSNFTKRMQVVINSVDIGAERVLEKVHHYEKEIEDGWKYQLDANGNVAKDTSGNDIKITVYKKVSADVIETNLLKEGGITGSFQIFDIVNKQVIRNQPFSEQFGFNHIFSTMTGDKRALPDPILKAVKASPGPAPFPPNELMLGDAFAIIKEKMAVFIDREINAPVNSVSY